MNKKKVRVCILKNIKYERKKTAIMTSLSSFNDTPPSHNKRTENEYNMLPFILFNNLLKFIHNQIYFS